MTEITEINSTSEDRLEALERRIALLEQRLADQAPTGTAQAAEGESLAAWLRLNPVLTVMIAVVALVLLTHLLH
ncbi:hypothetical protein [Oleisolibacter albus]|uniref:hypothetical protein n=1 Tax=Oleisolibacter albus TaxID=2171757 RepID=UPI000DF18688|nr:hypothetical protein [Oleisolibacter albus]